MDAWKDSLIVCVVRIARAAERLAMAHELLALTAADERNGGAYRSDVSGAVAEIRQRKFEDK